MIKDFLMRVMKNDELHWRWLNTLSYLEYIGARKIIKSQHEDDVDDAVLEHMAEEIHHAYYLKKIIARKFRRQTKYTSAHMLAKTAAKNYLHAIAIKSAHHARDARHAYLLASYIIETRALSLYTIYDALVHDDKSYSLASILKQEHRHLDEMHIALNHADPSFTSMSALLCQFEQACFDDFFTSLTDYVENFHA
jgi:hypothetical protein